MTSIELDLSILDMRPYNGFKMRPMFPDNLNVVDAAQAAWDRAVSMDLKIAGGLAIVSVVGFLAIKLFKVNGNAELTPRNGPAYAPSLQQFFGGLGILSLGCAVGNAIDRIFPTVYSKLDMRPYNGFKMRSPFPDNLNVVDAAQAAWDRAVSMDLKIAGGLAIVSAVGFLAIKLFKVNGNAESTPRNGLAYAPSLQQLFGGLGILSLGCAIGNAIDRIFPTVYSN